MASHLRIPDPGLELRFDVRPTNLETFHVAVPNESELSSRGSFDPFLADAASENAPFPCSRAILARSDRDFTNASFEVEQRDWVGPVVFRTAVPDHLEDLVRAWLRQMRQTRCL